MLDALVICTARLEASVQVPVVESYVIWDANFENHTWWNHRSLVTKALFADTCAYILYKAYISFQARHSLFQV